MTRYDNGYQFPSHPPRGLGVPGVKKPKLPEGRRDYRVEFDHEGNAVGAYALIVSQIKARAEELGWTQADLAEKARLPISTVSAALVGSRWPRWRTLEAMAEALGTCLIHTNAGPRDPEEPIAALIEKMAARDWRSGDVEITLRSLAEELDLRANTISDLKKPDWNPSSATVLFLACYYTMQVELD